eukprot:gene11610-7610_t
MFAAALRLPASGRCANLLSSRAVSIAPPPFTRQLSSLLAPGRALSSGTSVLRPIVAGTAPRLGSCSAVVRHVAAPRVGLHSCVRPILGGTTPRLGSCSAAARVAAFGRPGVQRSMSSRVSNTVGVVGQVISWVRHNSRIVAVLGGAALVMYGFYRGSLRLMHFFFNVSDKQIFNIGFIAGALAFVVIAATGVYTQRRLTFHVDDVYRAALKELRKHEVVKTQLGELWRPTGFRGYRVESLDHAIAGSERRSRTSFFEAPARRVQMIFMLQGIEGRGMVSLEAHKR